MLNLVVSNKNVKEVKISINGTSHPQVVGKDKPVVYLDKVRSYLNTSVPGDNGNTKVKTEHFVNEDTDDVNSDISNDVNSDISESSYQNENPDFQNEDPDFQNEDPDFQNESKMYDGDSDMEDNLEDKTNDENESKSIKRRGRKRKGGSKKEHACHICGLVLSNTTGMNAHIRRVHLNEKQRVCGVCSKRFYTNYALSEHVRRIHLGEKNDECNICKRLFFVKREVTSHKKLVHRRPCSNCKELVDETTPWKDGVTRYTPRIVKCKCGYDVVFKSNNTSWSMEEIVMGEKAPIKYPCEYCGKVFSSKGHVKRHALIHTEKRQAYQCHTCNKTFPGYRVLQKHYAEFHGVAAFRCKYCRESFMTLKELTAHKKAAHNQGQTSTVSVENDQVDFRVISVLPSTASTVTDNNDLTETIVYIQE